MDTQLLLVITTTLLLEIGVGFPVAGFASKYPTGKSYRYQYSTETLINEPDSKHQTQAQKDVGLKFTGVVELTPVWNDKHQMFVRLSVSDTHAMMESVSRKDLQRALKSLPKLPIFFQWSEGKVGEVYSAKEDSTLSINIKKGIISLFQLVNVNKQRHEVDASGNCQVKYQSTDEGHSITKTKSACKTKDREDYYDNVNPMLSLATTVKSESKYTLKDDVIQSVQGVETIISRLNMRPAMATSVINRQELTLQGTGSGPSYNVKGIPEVIKVIKRGEKLSLEPTTLETAFEWKPCGADCPKVGELVDKYREDLMPESLGSVDTANAFLELVERMREATKSDLIQLLRDEENEEIVPSLIDCMTAAQTVAGQAALMEYLVFTEEDDEDIALPERYLLAVAFSTHPGDAVLKDLLRLHKEDVPNLKLRESITEALGAVLNTHCRMGHHGSAIAKEVQKRLIGDLEACTEESLKPLYLRALANAGLPDTIPLLLAHAQGSASIRVGEEAVRGLRRMGASNIQKKEVRSVMKQIFHQKKRGYDSAIRTHALKYILQGNVTKDELREILLETTDLYNTDYSLHIQARVLDLMGQDTRIRQMGTEILKEEFFRNWDFLALKGKALAFTGNLGQSGPVSAQYSLYVENSRAGIMKRSGMDTDLTDGENSFNIYNCGIFAAGIESLIGDDDEEAPSSATPDQEEEVATAGIALDLLGVSLRPITFFEGSAGLMSAVWSAPSEPMSALQTSLLLQDHHMRFHLGNGLKQNHSFIPTSLLLQDRRVRFHLGNGLVMEADVHGALSLDLSGSVEISLWNKNSKSLIAVSGAIAIRGSMRLMTSTFRSGLKYSAEGSSVINFQTDVDFYDGIKLCLQMYRPELVFSHDVEKFEYARGFKKGYIATIRRRSVSQPVSYPLPKANNKQCRLIIKDEGDDE